MSLPTYSDVSQGEATNLVTEEEPYSLPYAARDTALTKDGSHGYMKVKKSHFAKGAIAITAGVFMVGVAIGVWAGSSKSFSASTKSKSLETTGLASDEKPSTWVSTAPTGPMHTRASPRSLSAAEFVQTPKFSQKVADQIATLQNDFHGKSGEMYSDPEEKLEAHKASAHAISNFIGKLSESHPQVAVLLHDMQLDDTQQDVAHKVLDQLTDKDTQKLGAEVIDATARGMLEGERGIKTRLQEKLGPNLDELRRIKMEIFPKSFSVDQDQADHDAHLQMLNQGAGGEDLVSIAEVKNHLNHGETGGEVAGRRLMGAWAIVNLIGSIIGSIVCTLIGALVPGKTAAYITMGLNEALTVVTCAQWALAPLNWVGCVINLINSVLVTIFTFV